MTQDDTQQEALEEHRRLVAQLRDPGRYPWPVDEVSVVETHISTVLLAGRYVLKLKKPLDLGFLDFRALADRAYYCSEELRINGRLAPEYYLRRVAITGTPDSPVIDGEGDELDYAVLMRRFPDDALMRDHLQRGTLPVEAIDALAGQVAAFHGGLPAARDNDSYGTPEAIIGPARANFDAMDELEAVEPWRAGLDVLRTWTEAEFERLRPVFEARREAGHVRECHGDLHLGNVAWHNGEPIIFDGIEFDPALRWTDTAAEIAFTVMDLDFHDANRWARRFLSAYVEACGDHECLRVLRFYTVYRAMVRAKINALECAGGLDEGAADVGLRRHIELAQSYTDVAQPMLYITHGLSGSGKSTVALETVEASGAIRVRSDVERKRLAGLAPEVSAAAAPGAALYDRTMSDRTYQRLLEVAGTVLTAGYSCVVDASFLERNRRYEFRDLARRLGTGFCILDIEADETTLRERIARRAAKGNDPSDADAAVLRMQIAAREPLAADERTYARTVQTEAG